MRERIAKELWGLLPVFLVVAVNVFLLLHHEIWRDEAGAWLIAKYNTPKDLLYITSYEGHPVTWLLLLMPFAKLGLPHITMNILSIGILAVAAAIAFFAAPFDKISRILLIFNPLFIYAYAVIGRNYCLMVLAVVLLAWQYPYRKTHPIVYGFLVAFLAQTHLIMSGFAFGLGLMLLLEILSDARNNGAKRREETGSIKRRMGALILPLGSGLFLLFELRHALENDFVNLTGASGNGWQEFLLGARENWIQIFGRSYTPAILLSFFYLLFAAYLLKKKIVGPLIAVLLGSIVDLYVIVLVFNNNNYRYLSLACLLLWYVWVTEWNCRVNLESSAGGRSPAIWTGRALLLLMSASLIVMHLDDLVREYNEDYTDAKNAAAVLDTLPDDAIIFENAEECCDAVQAYLTQHILYDPFTRTAATYCHRDPRLLQHLSFEEFQEIMKTMFPDRKDFYILWSYTTYENLSQVVGDLPEDVERIYTTEKEPIRDETFAIAHLRISEP